MQGNRNKAAVGEFFGLMVIRTNDATQFEGIEQTGKHQQAPDWENTQRHEQEGEAVNAARNPGQELGRTLTTQPNDGRFFADRCIFMNLVEVGTEQDQAGGNANHHRCGKVSDRPGSGLAVVSGSKRQGTKRQKAEDFPHSLVAETKGGTLINVADRTAAQNQPDYGQILLPEGDRPNPYQSQSQTEISQPEDECLIPRQVDQGVGFVDIHPGFRIKHVITQIFPGEDENGSGKEGEKGSEVKGPGFGKSDRTANHNGHDGDAIHGWLNRSKPQFPIWLRI